MNTSTIGEEQATAFKARAREQWDRSAAGWAAHTDAIHAWLSPATEAMLDMAGVVAGSRVLDVAAGAGDQTMAVAQRVGPAGHVLATDISPAILSLLAQRVTAAGLGHVDAQVADGEQLPVDSGRFDAAVCRLGLMLFPRPDAALREWFRVLRPGGGACAMVFGAPDRNPCVATLMATACRHAGLPLPNPAQPGGLLSLGRPGELDQLFRDAGFQNVATTRLDAPFRLPSARAYLQFVRASASPIQQILGRLQPQQAEAAWQEMEERLMPFSTAHEWVGPNELLLTAARR